MSGAEAVRSGSKLAVTKYREHASDGIVRVPGVRRGRGKGQALPLTHYRIHELGDRRSLHRRPEEQLGK